MLLADVRVSSYGGCAAGPLDAPISIHFRSPRALVRISRAPRGLGLARAWVAGDIDIEGDIRLLATKERLLRDPALIATAMSIGFRTVLALGIAEYAAAGPTEIEYRAIRPGRHSIDSDLREIEHHYGLSTEFYRHLLGSSLTYSCAMFDTDADSLETAQVRKHDLICQKLRLGPGSVLLDIGCGWGGLLQHAASYYACDGVGLTASRAQYEQARRLVRGGHDRQVRITFGDYRSLASCMNVTSAASVGMYEHVGASKSLGFFELVRSALPVGARYLNQSIIRTEKGASRFRPNAFAQRYIFPNAQLLPLSQQLADIDRAGFRLLSVETYGESYALTISRWIDNLEKNWRDCVALEGAPRVRAWHIYLLGSLARFEGGALDLAQVLAETR